MAGPTNVEPLTCPLIGRWNVAGNNSTTYIREVLFMKQETQSKIKFGSWGLVIGAVIVMIIGFGWGGWSTASTTRKMTEKAILENQTDICVAQFMADDGNAENLAEFKKTDSWKRFELVQNGGWDKMPGQEKAGYGVARACVDGIELLMKK
jgi:hypothetical protein